MILPDKHINISDSLIGLGGVILKLLKDPMDINNVWKNFEQINNSIEMPSDHTFDHFILALDLLYTIGAIDLNDKEELYLCA